VGELLQYVIFVVFLEHSCAPYAFCALSYTLFAGAGVAFNYVKRVDGRGASIQAAAGMRARDGMFSHYLPFPWSLATLEMPL
jgi:hypothetical protein